MKRFTLLLWLILPLFVSKMYAVPMYPYPIDVTQSDGSVLTIKMHGDEYFNYATTSDGYLLKSNSTGDYEYARFINDEIVSTGVLARNNRAEEEYALLMTMSNTNPVPRERIDLLRSKSPLKSAGKQRGPALFGDKRILVILVNFSDVSFNSPLTANARFSSMLNDEGYSANGGTGSARDYFIASSNGEFRPTFDVFGPYTLDNNMAYYINDNRAMILEAAQKACGDINTADYDYDNNNVVDNVFVYYAGYSNAETPEHINLIHPHHSYINSPYECGGKKFSEYACAAELRGSSGTNMAAIGTLCHEFGHTLGLPDFYDVDVGTNYTVGAWDIMASGCYNNNQNTPPSHSAHERFFLGYMTAPDIQVLSARGRYELEPIATSNKAYLISSDDVSYGHNLSGTAPNPSEYFLLENRQAVGWDSFGLPATGMLVYHVQFSGGRWASSDVNNDPSNLLYDIIEANGQHSAANYSGHPFPGSTNRRDWEPELKSGTRLDAALSFIEDEFGIIKFAFRGGDENDPYIDILGLNKLLTTTVGTPSDSLTFNIAGGNLGQNVVLSFSETRFEMKLDGTDNWTNTITLQPDESDSTLSAVVYVRYNPTAPSYDNTHSALFTARGEVTKTIKVEGKSTRQIYITTPIALDATNVSPYAFQANWIEVYDPTYVAYYLSVYTKSGETTEKEYFTNFNNVIPFGWQSTFKTITTITPASAPCAVVFKTEQDTLYTPYYPQPVDKIKFWVRSEDTNQEGLFEIYGYNGEEWKLISTIPVNRSLTAQVKELSLNIEDNYNKFKFACNEISNRGMAFDDFTAVYKASYIVNKQMVNEADSFRVAGNVVPSTDYYYRVQATDQDPRGRYENITDFSNEIEVKVPYGEPLDSRKLTASIDDLGNVVLLIHESDLRDSKGNPLNLYVFSLTGQLVRMIPYSNLVENSGNVVISGLAQNNTYIISLGAKRKGKFAKVFIK